MVRATGEPSWMALSFGAFGGETTTTSLPFQWNQIGTTRGVPSSQL